MLDIKALKAEARKQVADETGTKAKNALVGKLRMLESAKSVVKRANPVRRFVDYFSINSTRAADLR